eukprot:gene1390-15801_t
MNVTQVSKANFVVTKRKIYYALGFAVFLVVYFTVRAKYFERSDFLRPVTRTIKNAPGKLTEKRLKTNDDIFSDILDNVHEGERHHNQRMGEHQVFMTANPWDKWMLENPHLQSVGEIFNRCDNRTRKTIGKVVLEQDKEDAKLVKILMLLNMTFDKRVTSGKAHMLVKYKGLEMYDNEHDLCEEALDLDTPLYCPISKGYKLRLRNYIKLPSYIPKGHYVIRSRVTDQDEKEFGCIEAEVMTGNDKS